MPLTIEDDVLETLGMSEQEARIEIACRWFDAGKMTLAQAAGMAGLERGQIEHELLKRKIPIYRPTIADYEHDVRNLKEMGLVRDDRRQ